MFKKICGRNPDWGLLGLRLGLAVPLIVHGWAKLQNIDPFAGMLAGLDVPAPQLFAWLVTLLEFVGGLMILLGLWTRYISALLVIQFLYILFTIKGWAIGGRADIDFTILAMALALYFLGDGKYSLEAMWGKKTNNPTAM